MKIRVLYVDPDSDSLEESARSLESSGGIEVVTTDDPDDCLGVLSDDDVDCVVSAYDLGDTDGIELYERISDVHDVPFVLFMREGSEEVASEAVAAGVTDYVTRDDGTALLAKRVEDAVQQREAEKRAERLSRINDVVRKVSQSLVGSSTRDQMEKETCQHLAASEPYVFAWIGEVHGDRIVPRTWEGVEEGYLDSITVTTDETETGKGPAGKTARTHEIQVTQSIRDDPDFEPWRDEALERGYEAAAAVPLAYDSELYGVLVVYADEPGAFDGEEIAVLSELGETVGYAMHTVEAQREAEVFRQAVEHAGHAIYITDRAGEIEYVNPAFEEITGYSYDETVGKDMRILESDEHDPDFYVDIWDTVLSGDVWQGEMINERKNGANFYTKQTVAPVTDSEEEIQRFVVVNTDMTERKRRQQRLQVLNRVLRHNLRNHMNIIVGYANMLLEDPDEIEIDNEAEEIKETGKELVRLSNKAREVEETLRHTAYPQRTENLTEILESKKDEFEDLDGDHNVEIEFDAPEERWVQVDRRFNTALHEVIWNAVQHNDRDKTRIEIEVSSLDSPGGWVELSIADNGPGIPENEREVLRKGEETPLMHGSGLGLWLVNWIIKSYGGEITIRDNDPRGSVVTLRLPKAQKAEAQTQR